MMPAPMQSSALRHILCRHLSSGNFRTQQQAVIGQHQAVDCGTRRISAMFGGGAQQRMSSTLGTNNRHTACSPGERVTRSKSKQTILPAATAGHHLAPPQQQAGHNQPHNHVVGDQSSQTQQHSGHRLTAHLQRRDMSILREVATFRKAMADSRRHQYLRCREDPLPLPGNLEVFQGTDCCARHGTTTAPATDFGVSETVEDRCKSIVVAAAGIPPLERHVRARLAADPTLHAPVHMDGKPVEDAERSNAATAAAAQTRQAAIDTTTDTRANSTDEGYHGVLWAPIVAEHVIRQQHPAFCSVAAAQTVSAAILSNQRRSGPQLTKDVLVGGFPVVPNQQDFFEPFTAPITTNASEDTTAEQDKDVQQHVTAACDKSLSQCDSSRDQDTQTNAQDTPQHKGSCAESARGSPKFPTNFFSAYGFRFLDSLPDFRIPRFLSRRITGFPDIVAHDGNKSKERPTMQTWKQALIRRLMYDGVPVNALLEYFDFPAVRRQLGIKSLEYISAGDLGSVEELEAVLRDAFAPCRTVVRDTKKQTATATPQSQSSTKVDTTDRPENTTATHGSTYIISSYSRTMVGQTRFSGGHVAPIGGFDPGRVDATGRRISRSKVLVWEVNSWRYPSVWIDTETFLKAIRTTTGVGMWRGLLKIET